MSFFSPPRGVDIFEINYQIQLKSLGPLALISGVIMPETFLSDISSKNFCIRVDLPHPGLPVMKIFILGVFFVCTSQAHQINQQQTLWSETPPNAECRPE